jgi:hypothetical protein
MITMNKAAALAKQAEQIEWYANIWQMPIADVRAKVAAATTADKLDDGVEYDIVTINRHIPRGAAIEYMFGRYQHTHD